MEPRQAALTKKAPETTPQKASILVLEDDEIVSSVLANLLGREGYKVTTAGDGIEGIALLEKQQFDLILSDIKMPRMGGIEFLKESRTLRPFTPVILITGYPTIDVALKGMKEGAFDFIHKPFRAEELQQSVEHALRDRQVPFEKWADKEGALLEEQIRRSLGRKIKELSALKNLGEEIRSLQGLAGVSGKIVKVLADIFECKEVALFLPSRGVRLLKLASSHGIVVEEKKVCAALEMLALWVACRDDMAGILDLIEIPEALFRPSPEPEGSPRNGTPAETEEDALSIASVLKPPYLTAQLHVDNSLKGIVLLSGKRAGSRFTEEDKDLMAAVANQIAAYIETERLFAAIQEENRRHEAELEMAQRVQRGILPKRLPQRRGVRIAGHCAPARMIGGDFYGFIETYDSTLRFYIGDVAGKGVPAALIMAMATNVLSEYGKQFRDPEKIMEEANTSIRGHLEFGTGNYVTAFFCIADLDKMELRYARAGHEPALYYHSSTETFEWLDAKGHVLGLLSQAEYEPRCVKIESGDRLVLFTDGVVEARNAVGEDFGSEKLETILRRCIDEPPDRIRDNLLSAVEAWSLDLEQRDDLSLLVVEFGYRGWEERTIFSKPDEANRIKAEIYEYLRALDLPAMLFEDLRFCTKEVFYNAIDHGNNNDPTKELKVSWTAGDDMFWLRVRDEGPGFDPDSLPDPTLPENACKLRGRGIFMLCALMDEVQWNDAGNEITIIKRLPNE